MNSEPARAVSPKPDNNTRLAVDRNRLAYERTMMAWIRTAISLITFGFSIYKFFQIQHESTSTQSDGLLGSANFGLVMIIIGLLALLLATLENRRDMNLLKAEFPDVHFSRSLARLFAALVSLLGIMGMIAVIFRK